MRWSVLRRARAFLILSAVRRRYPLMPVVSGPKGVFASVTRRRAREALTDAQQRLRRNAESCEPHAGLTSTDDSGLDVDLRHADRGCIVCFCA